MTSVTDTLLSEADLVTSAIPAAVGEEIARLRTENGSDVQDRLLAARSP